MVNADIARPNAAAPSWRTSATRAALSAATLTLLSLLAFRDAAISMVTIWISSSVYHHGAVVPLLSFWLIRRQGGLRGEAPAADFAGLYLFLAASALWLADRAANADILGHFAIVLVLIGAVVAAFGREIARRWSFALVFLFFMVPFGEELTPALQDWATSAVAAALSATGIENVRDGFMLTTSAGRFQMAESCAGLRFILAAAMTATLVSGLAFSNWRKRIAFILLALIVAVVANWARAFLLVFAATVTYRKIGVGPEHVALGWAFYGFLLFALIGLAKNFSDKSMKAPQQTVVERRTNINGSKIFAAGAAMIFAAAIYDAAVISSPHQPVATNRAESFTLAGFSPDATPYDWAPYAPQADATSTKSYSSGGQTVLIGEAYFYADRPGAEIGGVDLRAGDGETWRRIAVSRVPIRAEKVRGDFPFETLQSSSGARIDVVTLFRLGEKFVASRSLLKAEIAFRKLRGAPTVGGAVFIAVSHEGERSREALRGMIEAAPLLTDARKAN